MKTKFTALLLFAYSISLTAQTVITSYTPGISTEGAVYHLPKTAINISITTEKTTYTPGELCQYSERFLRTSNVSDKEETYYTIKETTVDTEGLPDEKKLYHIRFSSHSIAPLVELTESGILQSINTTLPQETETNCLSITKEKSSKPTPHAYMTEEMLMTGSKAKLAELVAKEIYSIRESRSLILRGQSESSPKDGEALQIILKGLQEEEEALMQLFIGSETTEVTTQTYQVIPEDNAEKVILGRFSRKLGLLHGDDLAGTPIYIDIKKKSETPSPVPAEEEQQQSKKKKNNKQDGLVYNLPGKASVRIYTNTLTLFEGNLPFGQFGTTETLSACLFRKNKDIKVTLSPTTGALLKVEE